MNLPVALPLGPGALAHHLAAELGALANGALAGVVSDMFVAIEFS